MWLAIMISGAGLAVLAGLKLRRAVRDRRRLDDRLRRM